MMKVNFAEQIKKKQDKYLKPGSAELKPYAVTGPETRQIPANVTTFLKSVQHLRGLLP
jgi:hypothetical protein